MIHAEKADHQVVRMCTLLGVSRSGYYKWSTRATAGPTVREQRHAELLVKIAAAHAASDGVDGSPRICADLRAKGEVVSPKTVAKVMRINDLRGIRPPPMEPGDHDQGSGAAHDPGPGGTRL